MLITCNNMMWLSFAPVLTETSSFYDLSEEMIDYLSVVFMVSYPIIAIPCAYYIEQVSVESREMATDSKNPLLN